MRLIDADKIEVMSWRAQGGREYASGFDDGVDYVVKKIDDAPTIDAIPVEWLEDIAGQYEYSGCTDSADVVMAIIEDWKKEQEDKNGRTMETF